MKIMPEQAKGTPEDMQEDQEDDTRPIVHFYFVDRFSFKQPPGLAEQSLAIDEVSCSCNSAVVNYHDSAS